MNDKKKYIECEVLLEKQYEIFHKGTCRYRKVVDAYDVANAPAADVVEISEIKEIKEVILQKMDDVFAIYESSSQRYINECNEMAEHLFGDFSEMYKTKARLCKNVLAEKFATMEEAKRVVSKVLTNLIAKDEE